MIMIVTFSACEENAQEKTADAKTDSSMHVRQGAVSLIDFSGVTFASKRDTTCRMPLSAGIADTAIIDDKVYGFCSKECKDEFVKTIRSKR